MRNRKYHRLMECPKLMMAVAMLLAGLLPSCSTVETIPQVRVLPNDSGIEAGSFQSHGPSCLLGYLSVGLQGSKSRPDVPSRNSAPIFQRGSLPNKGDAIPFGRVDVVSIERPADYNWKRGDRTFQEGLLKWQELLESKEIARPESLEVLYSGQLGEIPWVNGGRCFHAKLRTRRFAWGKAAMFLTSYVQGSTGGPVNNDMLYFVVQGFTNDGRYTVHAHFNMKHSRLPETTWDESLKGKAVFSIDDECFEAERWLATQSDASFSPTFAQCEAFLHALEIVSSGQSLKRYKSSN